MLPVIFQIGPLKIYSYGLMSALGFLVTGLLLKRELKRTGFPPNITSTLLLLIPFLAIGRPFRLDLLPDKGRNKVYVSGLTSREEAEKWAHRFIGHEPIGI